jgi:hypothetical protein
LLNKFKKNMYGMLQNWKQLLDSFICFAEIYFWSGPIRLRGQKIIRSANNVGNAGPHVRQTFLNDVFTFLLETQVVL